LLSAIVGLPAPEVVLTDPDADIPVAGALVGETEAVHLAAAASPSDGQLPVARASGHVMRPLLPVDHQRPDGGGRRLAQQP
jgi:hypothetical protein